MAEGNGWERGIFTTFRSMERFAQSGSPESSCLRPNVAKHVVLISDEDETLTDNAGNPLQQIIKSDGNQLRAFVRDVFGDVVFKFHSIIVNPYNSEGQACLATHGAAPGILYGSLSRATGGVIGSICAPDYGAQLGQIGQTISNSALTYPLGCVAVANNGQMGSVVNLANNQPVNTAYAFNGDKIEFAQALGAGSYRVSHFCYQ